MSLNFCAKLISGIVVFSALTPDAAFAAAAPEITAQPQNQSAWAGSNATFSVVATGQSPLVYQWSFKGTNLTNSAHIGGATNVALTITNVTASDAGTYRVVVSNNHGVATSSNATLTVLLAFFSPMITVQPTNQSALVNSNVIFTAIASGTAPLVYRWYFNGSPLSDGGRVSGSTTTNLSISNLQTSDSGIYQLIVTNNYGSATSVAAKLMALVTADYAFQPIYEFFPTNENPKFPTSKLAEGVDGYFYGTTFSGGSNDIGTVFKISRAGALTTLHSFEGTNDLFTPSSHSFGGLLLASDGNFYGTTTGIFPDDYGKIFRITSNGTYTSIANFGLTNGASPRGPLVQGKDGGLYGVTIGGGAFDLGTIFKVTTNGVLTSIFSFNGTNGTSLRSGLVEGSDGNFYGTTACGGINFAGDSFTGNGTAFKITTNGVLTTLVYFNVTNGLNPYAGLALGNDGNFYGTTYLGGAFSNGTAFKMISDGTLNTLVSFDGTNGNRPSSGMTQAADGKFYGITPYGIANTNVISGSVGTIYSVTTNGALAVIARFNGTNAQNPFAELTLARDGNLYGVTGDVALNFSLDGNAGLFFRLAQAPQITSITQFNSNTELVWKSFAEGVYRVEYKPSLASPVWNPFVPEITATNNISSFMDNTASDEERYYRVRLFP